MGPATSHQHQHLPIANAILNVIRIALTSCSHAAIIVLARCLLRTQCAREYLQQAAGPASFEEVCTLEPAVLFVGEGPNVARYMAD